MARDLDFVPRRTRPITPSAVAPVQKITQPTAKATPGSTATRQVGLWLIIIILVALGVWGLWQYFKPIAKTDTPALTSAPTTDNQLASTSEDNLFAAKTDQLAVQIYDSGAGSAEVAKLASQLKALGYQTENLEKSQFDYDKTYIWYQGGLLAEAQKIQSAMPTRDVTLKETKIAGSFNILVLLGTK